MPDRHINCAELMRGFQADYTKCGFAALRALMKGGEGRGGEEKGVGNFEVPNDNVGHVVPIGAQKSLAR